ncbi:hypothetical protein HRR83_003280 [Exophiala dermatitidis]|uniref:N-acetyltransferase domain-containing protein n=2 Tax=Exophiala dermatitidis TaxID=5970 RepID=H6BN30_EXODN|nr:uncharacterized protein HMPREF1120_00371 [Exophiala dermatitidis NIH/UT8656]KAJ4514808.1 hypothetical protein HRR75_004172 [Exophiala dermatitidis]EHY52154.1 hypothetical protein HMPREF1120_00371 [Exophiala dermatitidis NIH/UT8656]KAJ4518267.1 hypothetical protein HRR74_004562 [Exophiala dermatitidis]KAJ4521165.1 hypothetical protein HRR73_003506 [Exophiala dermatitidis]KAJ4547754.1 hypothetical protein HRR76_000380 [Exophiala dermatitidis]
MHVRLAEARNLSDLATVATDAMWDDELTVFLAPYRHRHPECLRQGFLRRAKKRFYGGHLLLAAVTDQGDVWWDGTEKIVGYLSATPSKDNAAAAGKCRFSWNGLEISLLRFEELFVWYTHSDKSIDRANWLEFQNHTGNRGPLDDIKDSWQISHLSVSPSYQRHGIGSALVEYVQNIAAKENIPVTLLASAQGQLLYKKLGFAGIGSVDYGAGNLAEAMVWYPSNAGH